MAEPCPADTASPAAAPEPVPEGERPPENPAAANSLGLDDFSSQENMVIEEVPDSHSLILIAWVFCCVGGIIIFVPLAFILMPLFSGGVARVKGTVVGSRPPEVEKVSRTTKSTRISVPTVTLPPRPTVAVPANCRKTSREIYVDVGKIKNDSFDESKLPTIDSSKPVYCIFNISRVHRHSGLDFLLYHFPWPICPKVIYWSLSANLTSGLLVSRAPELDKYNGFYNITSIARQYRSDIKVLFTLGGYLEDSGLFSLLGNVTLAETNLAHMVIVMLYYLQFHGLNIHLTEDPACEQYFKGRFGGLESFITTVRELVSVNAPIEDFKITLMVGTNKQLANDALRSLGEVIDLVFIDTFELFSSNFSTSFTGIGFSTSYDRFLASLKRETNFPDKICYSVSSLTRTWNDGETDIGPPLAVTERAGYASFQDFCDASYDVSADKSSPDAGKASIRNTNADHIATAYFLNAKAFSTLASDCLLVDSVDYGVTPKGCGLDHYVNVLAKIANQFRPPPTGR